MESRAETLLVRQHERVSCDLRAQISASSENGSQLRLARTLGDGSGVVIGTIVDCSPGGMGLTTTVFFPRTSILTVRALGPGGQAIFEGNVRVQRVAMNGREPSYYLGTAFADRPPPERVSPLIEAARRCPPGSAPGKGGAAVA